MAGIGSQTPNWREALAAVDSISHNATYVTSTNGKLDVNASATISGSAIPISGATTAIVTAIVDSSGNQISTFGGGTQYTDAGTPPAHPVGTMPIFNNAGTWSQVSNSAGLPVNIVGGSSSGTQYIQGGATVANPTGTAEIWFDGSGNPKAVTSSQPQPSNLTDGTNIASVVAGDTGFNGVATAGATKTYTFTTSSSGAQTILANTSTEGFSWIEVVYTSVGSGLALTGQFSTASGGTYVNSSSWGSTNGTPTAALGAANNIIYNGPVRGNFFQIAVSALTSGTFAGTVTFRAVPPPMNVVAVSSVSPTGTGTPGTAFYMAGASGTGNLTAVQIRSGNTDGYSNVQQMMVDSSLYNGSTWDRQRSATAASNTTGTGLLGAAALGFDGTNYQRITVNSTTTTSKFGADANILSILGTAPTSAGKLDVKGADGDVFVRQATAANLNMTAFGYDGATQRALSTTTGGILITENGATAAAVPTAATYQAGNAATALPAAATVGNLTGAMYDKFGRQVVLPNAQRDLVIPMTQLTLTATTTETSLIGAVASTFNDILSLIVINTSVTATQVDFRDSTGGTIRLSLYIPAGDTRGISLTTPMPQAAVNTAWTAKCGTSVSSVIITGTYISNK